MSSARRRGLIRLAALLGVVAVGVVLIARSGGDSGSGSHTATTTQAGADTTSAAQTTRLTAALAPQGLPAPLSGEALVAESGGVLVIGGVDSGDTSTDSVLRLDPAGGRIGPDGKLAQPLHDAAAAPLAGQTLVFGGGAASTFDTVQALNPGSTAQVLGKLPTPASDLTALELSGSDYVLGGYDGQTTVGSVVKTSDGRSFNKVAELSAAVRYPAVAGLGNTIYVFGGELSSGHDTDEIQAVDTASGRASVIGRLPKTLAHASAVELGGAIYLLGGRSNGSTSDKILRFDPASHVVSNAGRLPMPVTNSAAVVSGNTGYLVGGLDSSLRAVDTVITVTAAPGA
jgi:hypothetical protein